MIIQLPYPHKALWPNGRAHWGTKASETKKHRAWAFAAMLAAMPPEVRSTWRYRHEQQIPIRIIVSGKKTGALPDADNCVAAAKSYLDGIAEALQINDNLFDAPTVYFSGRQSNFTIEVGQ